jgi:hypothetical protein
MKNLSLDFDKYFFRPLDVLRVGLKRVFTRLCLRDKQSCKCCGRDQSIVWTVKNSIWDLVPKRYQNTALCLECFCKMVPDATLEDFTCIFCEELNERRRQ